MAARYAWRTISLTTVLVGTVVFVNDNVVETSFIEGESMSPTLSPDYDTTRKCDMVLWNKWGSATTNLKRGDVILFRSPSKPDVQAVKRVIATEGDKVILDPRRRPSRQRDGADTPESRGWDAFKGRVGEIPEGHVWVEGDYWRKTHDSNAYGPISKSLVLGKAVAVVWPPNRFWTKPWEGFESRTEVVPGTIRRKGDEMGLVHFIKSG